MSKRFVISQKLQATFVVDLPDNGDPQDYADRIEVIMRSDREAEAVEGLRRAAWKCLKAQ